MYVKYFASNTNDVGKIYISGIHKVTVKLALEVKWMLAWDEKVITWNSPVDLEENCLLFWL